MTTTSQLADAVVQPQKLAAVKGMGTYVLRVGAGFKACLFCDENPLAVVAVVGPDGSIRVY